MTERWLVSGEARIGGYQGHYGRDYLGEAQAGRCAVCSISAEWQGRPLVFVLDHVNGDPTDNRRENLRLICPNCDSQLPTYKSRNRGRGRHFRRERYARGQSYQSGSAGAQMGVTEATSHWSPDLSRATRTRLPVVVPCGLSLLVVTWFRNSSTTACARSAETTPPA